MAALNRAAFVEAAQLRLDVVTLPCGREVVIRELTGEGRDQYDHFVHLTARTDWKNIRAKLVQLTLYDPDTEALMFNADEVGLVGNLGAVTIDAIFERAKVINMLEPDDVGELEKKS